MAKVVAYHRPNSIEEALTLLRRPSAVALGGGTHTNTIAGGHPVEVVDLQALRLDTIVANGDRLRIGAMARLDDIARHAAVPPLIAELARREAPSTLRTIATIGGTVVTGHWESELLAALLAHEATVTFADQTSKPLAEVIGASGGLVVEISIDTSGVVAADRTARTPADRAIVAAVARRRNDGTTLLALSGVAKTPIVCENLAELSPPGDFRGSPSYRKMLAQTLAARVL